MSTDIVIVAAARTAVGKFGGTLARTPAPELGATVIRALPRMQRRTVRTVPVPPATRMSAGTTTK